jgi:tetratricopeptide (TPR) repeat protein
MQRRELIFTALLVMLSLFSTNSLAQGPVPTPRSPLDATNWGVVYDIPATKDVKVQRDVPYLDTLTVDIFSPPDLKAGEKRPAVVFVNAVGDRGTDKVKNWGIYQSWPRLVAAHGLIGIAMDADGTRIQESVRGVFDFLTTKGAQFGVDGTRLGLYAASANVRGTYEYLIGEHTAKGLRAAALYYGGVPAGRLRTDLPVLCIVAQGDAPGMGAALGTLWQRVVEAKAPWSLLYASNLPHAFDAFSDNDEARRIIQQSLAFWKSHLEAVPQPPWQPSPARAVVAALYANEPQRAVEVLGNWLKENPNDAGGQAQYGRMLLQLRRFDEATAAYEKAQTLGSNDPGIFAGLGQIKLGQRQYEQAIPLLTRAIEAGMRNSLTYGQLAYAQIHAGHNAAAIKSYEKAFEVGIPPGANTRGVAYFNMACAYTRLEQKDKAFEALANAITAGFTERNAYETDDDLKPLRGETRFQELLTRLPKS